MGLHTILLDAGPLITNDPAISTLVAKSENLFTTSAVLSELKDKDARARVQTTVLPFLTVRNPNSASIKIVSDFARKAGDLAVLSKTDIGVIALAYELECERNQGDWRLRRVPGQKGLNGKPPSSLKPEAAASATDLHDVVAVSGEANGAHDHPEPASSHEQSSVKIADEVPLDVAEEADLSDPTAAKRSSEKHRDPRDDEGYKAHSPSQRHLDGQQGDLATGTATLQVADEDTGEHTSQETAVVETATEAAEKQAESPPAGLVLDEEIIIPLQSPEVPNGSENIQAADKSSSDSEGWITPSNLKKHQAKDQDASTTPIPEEKVMQVSTITSDFAMQNVLLQMNLNLLSPSLLRIKHLKTYILRCHACFQTTKQMDKQFCPRCGKPTLTRVSCSTNARGEFKLHLKKNMQWNTRGDRYSIPKPASGTSNGKVANGKGGGKGGWGQELILAEDQKEYVRAIQVEGRRKERNLMDEDYLPGILTGDRGKTGGRPRIGAGRNVNSRKRI